MSEPSVSVVMPVLNPHPVYFRQAVASVLQQTLTDLELIIVEDPSASSAGEMLADFNDDRIKHILNPTRTSFAAQINRGLDEARSNLIARFDADDICYPDRLQKQRDFLRDHPEVDLVGSQLEVIGPSDEKLGYRDYPVSHEAIVRAMPRFNPLPHPAVMYRKDAVLRAGSNQPTRHAGTEDYDLWSRMAKQGARFANYPEPLVHYRVHPQATKAARLRESIRGTLEVKRTYWRGELGLGGRLRMWAERALLWLPPRLVIRLFLATQLSRKHPAESPSGPR